MDFFFSFQDCYEWTVSFPNFKYCLCDNRIWSGHEASLSHDEKQAFVKADSVL
jgi:hypothetical protein